jgi:uncharacterized protein YutE (UPF0331/DUF86 family)
MSSSAHEVYQRKLQEIAADYRTQGYDVRIEPGPEELPSFLAGFRPDLIARGPHDSIVVEVKVGTKTAVSERYRELAEMIRQQPGWRFSLVVIDPRSDEVAPSAQPLLNQQEIGDRLERANELLKAGIKDAAFLLLWVSIEALLRHIATREGLPLERVPTSSLLKELFSLGILSRGDFESAQHAFAVRNTLVHGFETTGLDQAIEELTRLAQQLLVEIKHSSE